MENPKNEEKRYFKRKAEGVYELVGNILRNLKKPRVDTPVGENPVTEKELTYERAAEELAVNMGRELARKLNTTYGYETPK